MPIQMPQWTEVLSCPVCCKDFSPSGRQPVSLSCGHTACRMCLGKLHRQQCPFDQTAITREVGKLPTNYAILQLVAGPEVMHDSGRDHIPDGMKPAEYEIYNATRQMVEELALYLKVLNKASTGSLNGSVNGSTSGSGGSQLLSRPIQRKLVTLINCQLVEEEGRARAVRAARSLGERIVTELIIQHQNPQQLSTNLWAAVRARGCQFLGPAMQEETLKLVLLALEDGTPLSRKVLVMFVVQKLEQQFPQASKTSVGHVVQLLYRASCFKVTKREEESSLMQLKEEFRNYESLRREHDAQIVQIAIEAGLRISPEQWSSLLYGDLNHKSHMQSIIDKLQTPASFASSIQELTICLQRSGDPIRLAHLRGHLEKLAAIDPSPGAMISLWEDTRSAVDAVKKVVQGLMDFMQNFSQNKKALDLQTQNIKYKTSMCRDIMQKGGCPRGPSCTFAHCEEELEKYRAKSRQLLTVLNNQTKNQKPSRRDAVSFDSGHETMLRSSSLNSGLLKFGSASGDHRVTMSESGLKHELRLDGESALESRIHGSFGDDQGHKFQESLRGLNEKLSKTGTTDIPNRDRCTAKGSLPSSNAELYLAARSMSRDNAEQLQEDPDPNQIGGRLRPQGAAWKMQEEQNETARFSPQAEVYYEHRRVPNNKPGLHPSHESAMAYKSAASGNQSLQPRVLVPTAFDPTAQQQQQPGMYPGREAVEHTYPYLTPLGGHRLYPAQKTSRSHRVYRKPIIQRYVDPTTMKAYNVMPADEPVEPSAPPESLLPTHEFEWNQFPVDAMEPHWDYYPQFEPHVHKVLNRQVAPVGAPILVPTQGRRDFADSTQDILPPKQNALNKQIVVQPPPPKRPLKVERGPSLTELKERKDYLVNVLDGIQGETEPEWENSFFTTSSTMSTQSPSSEGTVWPSFFQSNAPISSPSLSIDFKSVCDEDDDDDDDHDHRNNGIDVDEDLSMGRQMAEEKNHSFVRTSQEEQCGNDISTTGSYDPWTSVALFTPNTGKAVKETPTNYTMTYSKVLVRHVSANENEAENAIQVQGTHDMQEIKAMTTDDLKHTLSKVKQQDQRAGSSHFERGTKIQIEMERREDMKEVDGPIASIAVPPVPLPAQLVHKDPILYLYSKYPKDHMPSMRCSWPASRSARSLGRNTGPLKVSAGKDENTMPVNMTMQDCQVAPGFQTSNREGYYIQSRDEKHCKNGTASCSSSFLNQDDWEKNVDKLVECDPIKAEQKLKQALDHVSKQIQAKETAQHAHNSLMIDREEKALENMLPIHHSHLLAQSYGGAGTVTPGHEPSVGASFPPDSTALQMQERVLSKYARQPVHQRQDRQPPLISSSGPVPNSYPWDPDYSADPYAGAMGVPYADRCVKADAAGLERYVAAPSHLQAERTMHAVPTNKHHMEATDLRIAQELQNMEREDYVKHVEELQWKKHLEQQKQHRQELDMQFARKLAIHEAKKVYPYQ